MTHGDSAYAVNTNTCKGGGYNLSRTRICVEWGFQKIVSQWAGVDYDRRQQLFATGPGSLYLTAGLIFKSSRKTIQNIKINFTSIRKRAFCGDSKFAPLSTNCEFSQSEHCYLD